MAWAQIIYLGFKPLHGQLIDMAKTTERRNEREDVEHAELLEGQIVFKGPRKLGRIFGGDDDE